MKIDFRHAREQINVAQAEVAGALGITETEVDLYERSPAIIPLALQVKWLQVLINKATEKNRSDLVTQWLSILVQKASAVSKPLSPPLKGIDPGTPYAELYHRLNLLQQYIHEAPSVDVSDLPNKFSTPNDLRKQINNYYQKPNLVLTGGFDAGKSHMSNALLGQKVLPVGYQPATRVITFVRHIQDRPRWFQDDVLIVSEDFWHKDDKGKPNIDLQLFYNREHCQKNCLMAGGFELLQKYGVHNDEEDIGANSAIVYVNSPLLQACNLIDLPGFFDSHNENSQDAEKATSAINLADIIIYASPAIGHINSQDMLRLSNILKLLPAPENEWHKCPTLSNFFVVATRADSNISDGELQKILHEASKRLYKQLNETALENRRELVNREIYQEDLKQRCFSFWSETPERCERLFAELNKTLGEFFPQSKMHRVEREIQGIKSVNQDKYAELIEQYKKKLEEIEIAPKQIEKLEENEPDRQEETQKRRTEVLKYIKKLKQDSRDSFKQYAKTLLNEDNIEKIIRARYSKEKEAKEYATGYLVEKLQHKLEVIIKNNSEKLKPKVEAFLGSYQEALLKLPSFSKDAVNIPFDAQGSFLGGMAGLGTVGGLAAWAATLGNLGGYILVAKLVSLLSALGISIAGGTAAAAAFVAAIGGPIVLAVGLAAALAAGVWSLFGESWQKRLARELVNCFKEQGIVNKLLDGSDQFWQDTIKAFNQGADAVEADWQKYLVHQHKISSPNTQSKERIEEIIKQIEVLRNFFANIPWEVQA